MMRGCYPLHVLYLYHHTFCWTNHISGLSMLRHATWFACEPPCNATSSAGFVPVCGWYFTRHAYAHQQHFSFIAKLAGGDSQEIAKPVISWEHKPLGRDGVSWLSQSRADRQWIRCYPHIHSVFRAYASLKYKFCGSLSFFFFSTKTTVLCFAI